MIIKSSFSELKIRLNKAIYGRNPRISLIFRPILSTRKEPQKSISIWFAAGRILLIAAIFVIPISANAGVFSFMADFFGSSAQADEVPENGSNSQKMPLLQAVVNSDPNILKSNYETTIESGNSLVTSTGPIGTVVNVKEIASSDQITTYIVREGDTLPTVAKMFDVSPNTILWANDLKPGTKLKVGQTLVILPISGIQHTVKKGETLKSIATAYKGDIDEITQYNNLPDNAKLAVGDILTIPNGEASSEAGPVKKKPTTKTTKSVSVGVDTTGYFQRPIAGGRRTQGLHGHNGVDLADSPGTPVMAAAGGQVIIARASGWNGGYGEYVVVSHANGTQTLYAHLSEVNVNVGENVVRGQLVGKIGSTGESTGMHLHFEVRGGVNPF